MKICENCLSELTYYSRLSVTLGKIRTPTSHDTIDFKPIVKGIANILHYL